MVRSGGIHKPRGLRAIDRLVKIAMKESILHIELMNGPRVGGGKAQDDANGGRLDNRTESLSIINAFLLIEPANNLSCFVASQRAVGVELVTKNPFPRDHVDTCRFRHQRPSKVVH